jgi:hypothetical protein
VIDGIDLLNIPRTLQKIDERVAITSRENQVLVDYLEEYPVGKHAEEIKSKRGSAMLVPPEVLPTPEELEAEIAEADTQHQATRKKRRGKKGT